MHAAVHADTGTPGRAHARVGLPNGLHHLAIATRDVKAQIEFFTDVIGLELVALYWMHGVADTVHAFLRLSDTASLAFVQGPEMQFIEPQLGVSHAGFTAGPVAPGAVQHVALNVDTEDELLAMRDRMRSRGHFVMGPIDHGMCKSIYFAGPEGLQLELATGSGIDPAHWIDPEVVAFCGIEAADLRRYRAPAAFPSQGGAVPQPDPCAKPTFVFPDEMRETADVLFAASDAEIAAALDHPEPPVPEPTATRGGAGALGRPLLLALCLLASSMLATPSHARKAGAAPCEPGAFALSAGEQALLETALGEAPIDRVTLGPDGTVSLGACAAAAKIRPTKKQTVVTARWTSCGVRRRVRLAASLRSPSCETLTATVRGKGFRPVQIASPRLAPATTTTSTTTTLPSGGDETTTTLPDGGAGTTTTLPNGGGTTTTTLPGGVVTTTTLPGPPPPITSQQLIADALAAGAIDYPTSLLYRAWALFNDSNLPAEYDGEATAGEDLDMFGEIVAALDGLTPELRAALEPFVVRPTEPSSYFSAPLADAPSLRTNAAPEPNEGCPDNPATGQADWRTTETPHFVVWSCGRNDPADPTAQQRGAVGAVAEELWATMTPETGPFKGDSHPVGPAPQSRIDIYVLDVSQCRKRRGGCKTIERTEALAVVIPAGPCDNAPGGPDTASGYVMVPLSDAPETAPSPTTASPFRSTLAHEFFHLFQFSSNLRGTGRHCSGPERTPAFAVNWLRESTASWAEWAFAKDDEPPVRTWRFQWFQERPATTSVHTYDEAKDPYEAFIYHSFWQQESGGSRAPLIDLWKTSPGARTPDDLERYLDALFPFAEHFRDFAVRNVNPSIGDLAPGDPVSPLHGDQDPAIPHGMGPVFTDSPSPVPEGAHGAPYPLDVAPLSAQYERHFVFPSTRYVKLDFSDVPNASVLDLDVLARVRGTWKRIKVDGSVFEFCRDDPAEDIDDYVLVVSNHERRSDVRAAGSYRVSSATQCPERWGGTIVWKCTLDETSVTGRTTRYQRHEVERQIWTVVGQGRGPRPDLPPGVPNPDVDHLDLAWTASLTLSESSTTQTGSCLGSSITSGGGTGSAAGPAHLFLQPAGTTIAVMPEMVTQSVRAPYVQTVESCSGHPSTTTIDQLRYSALSKVFEVPELRLLTPEPDGSINVSGSQSFGHLVEPRPGNGQFESRCDLSWTIRRRRAGL